MSELAELGAVAKSMIGHSGKHIPITEMNSRQIAQLRSRVTNSREARRRGKVRTFGRKSITAGTDRMLDDAMQQQQQMARTIPGGMPKPRYTRGVETVEPSSYPAPFSTMIGRAPEGAGDKVRHYRDKAGMKRKVQVTGPQPGMPEIAAAAAQPTSRSTGIVAFGSSTVPPADSHVAHEIGHLSPKRRTLYRMAQITRSPKKHAREEGRADAFAARMAPGSAKRNPTAYEHWGRAQDRSDTTRRSIGAPLERSDEHFTLTSGKPFSPMQGRQYNMVRRRTGTWD